ncbi:MAG TPA: VCBS repeat-containing protein [Cyclobacteriaceae bacterium]|nr:VCBS repeat-containing protein [Cyclobacteriaceae bacterium]
MSRESFLKSFLLVAIFLLVGCTDTKEPPLLEQIPANASGLSFSNELLEDEQLNIITFEYFYNGAGVGIGDVNSDGLVDIFFSANMSGSRLYLNKGELKFEDITQRSGIHTDGKWATGVSMVDINQDGWLDIYVCFAGPYLDPGRRANELYINNKDNTFSEQAEAYGLADTGHTVQAAFFDYDRDNDLDVYLLTNKTFHGSLYRRVIVLRFSFALLLCTLCKYRQRGHASNQQKSGHNCASCVIHNLDH